MRWDRLFADLEGAADDWAKDDVDALAADLGDEAWGSTAWVELLGGHVVIDVRGAGQLSGDVASVNDALLRLRGSTGDVLVATRAVVEVVTTERRADPSSSRARAVLGWSSALRRLRDVDEPIRICLLDGRTVTGRLEVVGRDFVRLEVGSGRRRLIVLDGVATVAPHL